MITISLKKKKSQLGFHKNDASQTATAVISSNKDIPQFGPYISSIVFTIFPPFCPDHPPLHLICMER